jgi:hypothetical protein
MKKLFPFRYSCQKTEVFWVNYNLYIHLQKDQQGKMAVNERTSLDPATQDYRQPSKTQIKNETGHTITTIAYACAGFQKCIHVSMLSTLCFYIYSY